MRYYMFKVDKNVEKRLKKEEKARKLQNRAEAAQRLNKRGKWV